MTIKRMLENKIVQLDVSYVFDIRNVKLNDFVFQHAFYCHVCHCSLSAKEKAFFLWFDVYSVKHK